jgi:hypothetical protein
MRRGRRRPCQVYRMVTGVGGVVAGTAGRMPRLAAVVQLLGLDEFIIIIDG